MTRSGEDNDPVQRMRDYITSKLTAEGKTGALAEFDQMWARHDDPTASYPTWTIPLTGGVTVIEPPDSTNT